MRAANLPSLRGTVNNANQVRVETAKAISSLEVYAQRAPNMPPGVARLTAFFNAGLAAMTAIGGRTASIASVPNPVVAGVAASTQQLAITQTKMDATTAVVTGTATYTTSDATKATCSSSGLVTRVATGSAVITVMFNGKFTTVPVAIS